MIEVQVCVNDGSDMQIHQYATEPDTVPRIGESIEWRGRIRRIIDVRWGFEDVTHGAGPGWVMVLVEPLRSADEDEDEE